MDCKNCGSSEVDITNDPLYSKSLCYNCGYYCFEDGAVEKEIYPFCLLIVNDSLFEPIETYEKLMQILRKSRGIEALRTTLKGLKITLRQYNKETGETKEKTFYI